MIRPRNLAILAGAAAATVAVLRHGRRAARGHTVAGGLLIGHAGVYDTLSRLLLGPLIDGIAADVARRSASRGERHALALALAVQPHPADRAGPRR